MDFFDLIKIFIKYLMLTVENDYRKVYLLDLLCPFAIDCKKYLK